ncbi:type VI secretion system tube protein Hcp [Paraburkholderia sp. MMS20-SJTR3]|uniref:Type VI secretion system tube protein Hcp n=1 Tax=Paraburkholderia sejongensis TaxID=2886946 RepID=A0ABS8JRX4_9BURK|nr:type VI secretion system tube protein Hcp [Paraburkholderia sp. MMS20-SJTR3]MCC8392627.1 type VI secretion system tube protein Hcp [Paraburkholderia sp. MMS20-SJTR3]
MPIPAHMWLKDDGGADILGSSSVQDRQGSIEIISFGHGVNLPVDAANGKITGARAHSPIALEKEFDRATPYLYKAVATGQTLQSVALPRRQYQIHRFME